MLGVFICEGVGVTPENDIGVDPTKGVLSFQFCPLDYPGLKGVSENLLGVIPGLKGVLSLANCFFLIYSLIFRPPKGVASHLVLLGVGVSGFVVLILFEY